jgi:hypothetical protein
MFTGPTFTGTVNGVTATMVGLGSVTNDLQVPASAFSTKGVLLVGTGSGVYASVPTVATNGWLLTANSTSASGVAFLAPPAAGVWGSISGTLADQSDLGIALAAKVSTATTVSVDSEIALFSGTTGKVLARSTATGLLKAASGVIGVASTATDYVSQAAYTTKGVLLVGTGSGVIATLPVASTNGYVLTVATAQAGGMTWQAASGFTRGTFTSASLATGTVTITHNLGLSAPYSMSVKVFNNAFAEVIPDSVTGSINSFTLSLVSYGTISGTYGYIYGG